MYNYITYIIYIYITLYYIYIVNIVYMLTRSKYIESNIIFHFVIVVLSYQAKLIILMKMNCK